MALHVDGVTTFTVTGNAWQEHDAGLAEKLLCLRLPQVNTRHAVRQGGETGEFIATSTSRAAGVSCSGAANGAYGRVLVPTTAAGKFDARPAFSSSYDYLLESYLDLTSDGQVLINSATTPTSWTDYTITSLSSGGGIALIKVENVSGSTRSICFRSKAVTADTYDSAARNPDSTYLGVGRASYILVSTNAVGQIQIKSNGATTVVITVLHTVDDAVISSSQFYNSSPSAADTWQEGISTGIGESAFCTILIGTSENSNKDVYIRRGDDAGEWIRTGDVPGCARAELRDYGSVSNFAAQSAMVYTQCDSLGEVDLAFESSADTRQATLLAYVPASVPTPSGYARRNSFGSQPQGNAVPYPSVGTRVLFREDFYSTSRSKRLGLSLIGSPDVDRGLVLDSSPEGADYDGSQAACSAFGLSEQWWQITFTPTTEADADDVKVLFDADIAGATEFGVRKLSDTDSNVLRLTVGGTNIDVPLATYQAEWAAGTRVTLTVSVDVGTPSVDAWLGDTQIVNGDATATEIEGVDGVFVGVDNGGSLGTFSGTIHRVLFGRGTLDSSDDAPGYS